MLLLIINLIYFKTMKVLLHWTIFLTFKIVKDKEIFYNLHF